MPRNDLCELVFILDESGSMSGLEDDTVGGYNAVLREHRELPGDATVSTVLFDNRARVLHDRIPIADVRDMKRKDYRPGGCTALLDAVGGAISYHKAIQRALPDGYRAGHVIFVIVTDGYENASRRYSYPEVKRLIEERRESGWEFLFLAANIDVAGEADKLGFDRDCAFSYDATPEGLSEMYDTIRCASAAIRAD